MSKLEITFRKSAQGRRGCGQLTWGQFAAMLRSAGVLMDGQHLEQVTVTKDRIQYTTDKTGNQK